MRKSRLFLDVDLSLYGCRMRGRTSDLPHQSSIGGAYLDDEDRATSESIK
jgi:hypothetical protein